MPTNNVSIDVFIINLRELRVIIIINGETSLTLDLEGFQDTCVAYVLGSHYPGNGAIVLRSVDGCDEPMHQCRGHVSSSDESFGCDAINNICFNSRDAILVDARKVIDALLVEARQGCEDGDAFMSEAKH